jgi:hypothetical protein
VPVPPFAVMGGRRLRGGLGQLLPRFLKTPLIAGRVQDISPAAAREQRLARDNDHRGYRRYGSKQLQRSFHIERPPMGSLPQPSSREEKGRGGE